MRSRLTPPALAVTAALLALVAHTMKATAQTPPVTGCVFNTCDQFGWSQVPAYGPGGVLIGNGACSVSPGGLSYNICAYTSSARQCSKNPYTVTCSGTYTPAPGGPPTFCYYEAMGC